MTPEQRGVSMNCYASRHAVTVVGDRIRDLDSPRKTLVRSVLQTSILSVTGLCDSLAFKVTLNEFDVTDGTATASGSGRPTVSLTPIVSFCTGLGP